MLRRGPKRVLRKQGAIDKAHEMIGELAEMNARSAPPARKSISPRRTEDQAAHYLEKVSYGVASGLYSKTFISAYVRVRVGLRRRTAGQNKRCFVLMRGDIKPIRQGSPRRGIAGRVLRPEPRA